jgi:hypothetical protein
MAINLVAFGVSTTDGIYRVYQCSPIATGRAAAHVGAPGVATMPREARQACVDEQEAMRNEVRAFVAYLEWLAKSDPNYALWVAEGSQSVPADAFIGTFDDVVADSDREDWIGG